MDEDQRLCDCGAIDWIDDMHDDGENDPVCNACYDKWVAEQMAMLNSGTVRAMALDRWYADQGLLGVGKHSPLL
jgi:hypothetical protein